MDQMIKAECVNYKELVSKSTKLSLTVQSKLVDKLKNHFNEEEQRLYIANLYMYMNYNSTEEYPINLETVWKFAGFSNKANAKRLLKNNFTEEKDYKKLLIRTDEQVPNIKNGKNVGGAGLNEETIMLNINTFKKLCLRANTKEADKIHDYYVKLENIYNEVIKEELEEQKRITEEQLQEQQKLLEDKETEIEQIQTDRLNDKKLEKHKLLFNKFNNKNVIYLVEIAKYLVKVGSTYDLHQRLGGLKRVFGCDGILLDVFECSDFRNAERYILNDVLVKDNRFKEQLPNGHTSNEVVVISEDFTYEQLVAIVEKHVSLASYLTPSQLVENKKYDTINELLKNNQCVSSVLYASFTPAQLLEKQRYDTILSLVKDGVSGDDISKIMIHQFDTQMISQVISQALPQVISQVLPELISHILPQLILQQIPKEVPRQIQQEVPQEVDRVPNVVKIKPNYGRAIQQIDPDNLTRVVKYYKNMESLMNENVNRTFSETGIRDAVKNNTIYKKYRWMFVENGNDPSVVYNIQPNVSTKKISYVILELNEEKSEITKNFMSISVASQELKMDCRSIVKLIKEQKLYNGHYYIYLEDAPKELLDKYDVNIFNFVPHSAVRVKSIHPETREERIFPSLAHAYKEYKVHHKTIHKAINDKTLLNGFYWELI